MMESVALVCVESVAKRCLVCVLADRPVLRANCQPNEFTTKVTKSLKKSQALIVVSGGGVPF